MCKYLWVAVEADEYELPLAVAETATDEPYEYEIKAMHKDHIEPYVIIEDEQTDCPWK